jgi:hypothetical protein
MYVSRAQVVASWKSIFENLLKALSPSLPFLKVVAANWLCYE